MQIKVVNYKDTVDGIAAQYGIPVERLIYDNQIPYPYRLAIGQALLISEEERAVRPENIRVNGYAYTYISPWVLEQTLPFLMELSVFSYGFTAEGALVEPPLPADWMIGGAKAAGVMPLLTLTPFGADGKFNNYLIHAVVSNPEAGETLINNLLRVMKEYGYQGLDIDFEYIMAEDRDLFTEFVREVTDALHAEGYRVSIALAPKTSANQPGLLYEGKDYRALGEIVDAALLMTYEWGYKYGPPMAVAPLNMVRRVVEYAVTEIPPEKLYLGIPNYGYDWSLPFVRGETAAKTIGNVEAVQIAVAHGAVIQFDETARSPYFYYWENGVTHEVWFEDVRSLTAKFDLIRQYHLAGAGYWNIMQYFRANWLLLSGTL
ncbi:MAG: glycosyl hydrolase family 18 protein [Hominisplanchenecus sp.]|nr:glycosyl hydrolase family 18 protein [Hominisplanchenecus sp.]